jgi:hypothetical protein
MVQYASRLHVFAATAVNGFSKPATTTTNLPGPGVNNTFRFEGPVSKVQNSGKPSSTTCCDNLWLFCVPDQSSRCHSLASPLGCSLLQCHACSSQLLDIPIAAASCSGRCASKRTAHFSSPFSRICILARVSRVVIRRVRMYRALRNE